MTIQEQIKQDLKQAMLNKDELKKSILRVVIGEFNRIGKEVDDTKAMSIIKKMGQNAQDQDKFDELHILASYLPDEMDEAELTVAINEIIKNYENSTDEPTMGKLMGELKARYAGTYDGKLASTLVKQLLS